jgi:ATP-dependent helicase/nuclease subunit A
VALTGTIRSANGTDVEMSGQIDRLIVDGNEVVIVDYKTNLQPPETLDQVPLEYRAQLSVYRELLKQIYPAKGVAMPSALDNGAIVDGNSGRTS